MGKIGRYYIFFSFVFFLSLQLFNKEKREETTYTRVPEDEPKRLSEQEQPEEGVDGDIDEEEGTKEVLEELHGKHVVRGGSPTSHEGGGIVDGGDEQLGQGNEDQRHDKPRPGVFQEHKGFIQRVF